MLKYPLENERKLLGKLISKEIEFDKNSKIDIAIFGIGFISVYGEGKLRITSFENVNWTIREAIV